MDSRQHTEDEDEKATESKETNEGKEGINQMLD